MARNSTHQKIVPVLLFLLVTIQFFNHATATGGTLGGRKEVKDVKNNKEIQELGRFCVKEYNRKISGGGCSKLLIFSEVIAAERQVVSGIKYYLEISAAARTGGSDEVAAETFEAVVVVKPWMGYKKLINFDPLQKSDY